MRFVMLAAVVLAAAAPLPGQTVDTPPLRPVRYDGLVAPGRSVDLRVPIEGLVGEVAVTEGSHVSQGDLLLRVDDAMQRAMVEAARLKAVSDAGVRSAAAGVQLAISTLANVRRSHDAGAAGDWEVERAETEVKQAEAEHDAAREATKIAEAELRLEEERLRRYRLEAPFDGVVTHVSVEPGETVTTEHAILRMVSLDPLEATLFLPVRMYGQLQLGQTYRLSASEPVNGEVLARLKFIDPNIDSASRTIRCLFSIANEDLSLPAGFSVVLASPEPVAPD